MSNFYDCLANRIRKDVEFQLAEVGDGNARLVFIGLPERMLEDVRQRIVNDEAMTVDVKGKEIDVAVLLLTSDENNSAGVDSGRCNQGSLVKMRNGTINRLLVLQPPDATPIISIETTFTKLGVSVDSLMDAQAWVEDTFVRQMLIDAASIRKLTINGSTLPDWFEEAMINLASLEYTNDYVDFKWTVIRRLFDQPAPDTETGNTLVAFAATGLVRPQNLTEIEPKLWKLTNEIGNFFEREGFVNGFSELNDCANQLPAKDYDVDSIVNALRQFKEHVMRVAESAPEFASDTLRYYCPYDRNNFNEIFPNWWYTLDSSTWRSLLDCRVPSSSCIAIEVTNNLAPDENALPSKIAVTAYNVQFDIESTINSPRPDLDVTRRVGRKSPENIGRIESGVGRVRFCDSAVPPHSKPLTYTFTPSDPTCKVASVLVIVLREFGPKFVAVCRSAEKVTIPKEVVSNRYNNMYECDLELDGQGIHQIDLLTTTEFKIIGNVYGYGVATDEDEDSESSVEPTWIEDGSRWNFDAQTDEECHYKFEYKVSDGGIRCAQLNLRAGDVEPIGASSEFHRLVLKVSRNKPAKISLRESQNIFALQRWMLREKLSYNPLLLTPSYRLDAGPPDWTSKPILSEHRPVYDPRPEQKAFSPPSKLVNTRHEIAKMILDKEFGGLCESVKLGRWFKHNTHGFRDRINEYLKNYTEWLKNDYISAVWFDTVIVCFYKSENEIVDPVPSAILYPPLHPARLGWQVVSQYLLEDALENGFECPGASVLDPTSLPDSVALPVIDSRGDTRSIPFVSIPCNSDYWSVLWNLSNLDQINSDESNQFFDKEFGIVLSGLSAGISSAQVKRAIQDVFDVNSGRSRLRFSLLGDLPGKSDADEGINQWARDCLGINDPWQFAARSSLDVIDARGNQQHPSQSFVANLIQNTSGAVRWFTKQNTNEYKVDLSIISHLKQINSEGCQSAGTFSATSIGSLTRERIRNRTLTKDGNQFIVESRTLPKLEDSAIEKNIDELASNVELIDWHFESALAERCFHDGISFAPNTSTLEKGLNSSSYCAVSSTDVDFSAFFQPLYDSYLWDYDLPSYAGKAQDNVGFFLMARYSSEIEKQIEKAWIKLGGNNLGGKKIRELLKEFSSRGLPSLKVLASGGSAAIGEIGVITAIRLLQGPLGNIDVIPSVLPSIVEEGRILNLLLPVDPFAAQIDDFRRAKNLKTDDFRRPDLLVASIRFDQNEIPTALRITPIEIKTRTGFFDRKARRDALSQAENFSNFLFRLIEIRKESPIWNLVVSKFLASWLNFGFRVYGENAPQRFRNNFMKCNASVNQAILRDRLNIEIDRRGRLIVISNQASLSQDIDGDGFTETVNLKSDDALAIIDSPSNSTVLQNLVEELEYWELVTHVEPNESMQSDSPKSQDFKPTVSPNSNGATTDNESVHSSGIRFEVGLTLDTFRKEPRIFFPGNTQLTQLNIGIVGNLGTGKTQLTKSIVYQVARSQRTNFNRKPFFLIFDYKKDYSDSEFTGSLGVKVITPRRMPINIFDTSTVASESPPWLERSNFLYDVLEKIYSGLGPVQKENLKESVKNAYSAAKLRNQSDPVLADVFAEYRQVVKKPDAIYSILSDMVDMELFEDDVSKIKPFSTYLDGVVVVDLAALGQNDKTKNILVILFLNLFYENMLKLEKHPFVGSNPQLRAINGFLLVDEADNIMRYQFPVLDRVLLQGREFGVGVLLASQYLSHFRPGARTNYKEPLLTWFIHQVPDVTVNELKAIGLTEVDNGTTSRIQKLDRHECLYKSLNVDGEYIRGTPYYLLRAREENSES